GRGEEEICAGSDGFRPLGDFAAAASLYAAPYRGAMVVTRVRKGVDSICRSTGKDGAGWSRRRSRQASACLGYLPDCAGWPQSSCRVQSAIKQEDRIYFTCR